MGRYVIRRLLWIVLVLFVVSAFTFGLMRRPAPVRQRRAWRSSLGLNGYHLDRSPRQYLRYVSVVPPKCWKKTRTAGYILPRHVAG
jgi:ABC-type dipeptide/oligopeptide/nickel transport system permease component